MDELSRLLELRSLPTTQAVMARLVRHATDAGFPIIALGTLPTPEDPYPEDFLLTNWPEAWRAEYFEKGYGPHDPVRLALGVISEPITVAEIRAGHAGFLPSPESLAMLAAAETYGCPEGLIVPVFGPHGYRGFVCFCGRRAELDARDRLYLHHLGLHAHHRLHELHMQSRLREGPTALTRREVEVLRAARDGHRDAAIAGHLGLSVRTVRFHFGNARRKLGASSRAEALARAINLHLI